MSAVSVFLLVAGGRTVTAAANLVFTVGLLGFGFGLTTWASAILLENSLERMAEKMDVSADFSPAASREAMSLLTAASAGGMAGAMILGVVLG